MIKRQYYLDYLRAGLILLIVVEHISIAYTSLATLNVTQCYLSDWFFTANIPAHDGWTVMRSFRMSVAIPLLFFISGAFVPTDIRKQGVRHYFYKRLKRIGLPLLFMALVLAPICHYLPCKIIHSSMSFVDFMRFEFNVGFWQIGPAWFLWTLLVFDGLACFFYSLVPNFFEKSQRLGALVVQHPKLALASIMLLTYAAYLVGTLLTEKFAATFWHIITGPFVFIATDIFVDIVFFILGIILSKQLLTHTQRLVKLPLVWILISGILFLTQLNLPLTEPSTILTLNHHPKLAINIITTPLLSVLLSISLLAIFQRYFNCYNRIALVISQTSFAVYIFHFPICLWLQFYLQQIQLSVTNKIILNFFATTSLIMVGYYLGRYFYKKITAPI